MAIDDQHLAIMALTNKSAALDRAATALKDKLNGDFDHDAPIQHRLVSVHAEQARITSRVAAIFEDQPFTRPSDVAVNELGDAIAGLDYDIRVSAGLNEILTDTSHLMQQYGAASSRKPPVAEPD